MAKIDLDSMNIDELVKLRESVDAKLLEKIAARQLELEAEMKRLSELGKPKKSPAAAATPKARKGAEKKAEAANEQPEPPVAEAA